MGRVWRGRGHGGHGNHPLLAWGYLEQHWHCIGPIAKWGSRGGKGDILVDARIGTWPLVIAACLTLGLACTFSPHPKSGVQSCSPGSRLCAPGYVCGTDDKCWLPADVPAGAGAGGTVVRGTGGSTGQAGAGGIGGSAQGGNATGGMPVVPDAAISPSGGDASDSGVTCSSFGNASPSAAWAVTTGGYVVSGMW